MTHVVNGASAAEDFLEDALDPIPGSCRMDLHSAIKETQCALDLVLNDKFSEALDMLKPLWRDSMYHALGYSTIMAIMAHMSFDHREIQIAMTTLNDALHTCQRFRKKNSIFGSLFSLVFKQLNPQEEEMHADICYAECLLLKALLTFQDENMISLIKGGLQIRTSYWIFKDSQKVMNSTQDIASSSDLFRQFEGGVKFGIGSFNLMLSLLPQRILRLLEFIGFSGNRDYGLSLLREVASNCTLRSVMCTLTLLSYHTYTNFILGTGEVDLVEAEALLKPWQQKYPNGSIFVFYSARIATLKGNFEKALSGYEECTGSQQEWRQIHHLCYWELMWCHSYQQNWMQAYQYADLLCKESNLSKNVYVYLKAAILSMMSEDEVVETGENLVELFRQVEGLKQCVVGKSISAEKFAIRKSRRYNATNPVRLVIPALEMMYMWNGFEITGKRADCTEALLITVEKAEEMLRSDPNPSEFHADDSCLVQMLKGLCLKHLDRLPQAELCFTQVLSSEHRIRYDHYLVPFTLFELGLLCKQQGDITKATAYIEKANRKYKHYSMEDKLHFRIHATLKSLSGSPASTPSPSACL